VRAASIPFSIMLNVGCMIGWLSLITTAMDKGSIGAAAWQFSCQAQIWLLSLSWALIFLALLAKTWRYGRIYSIPGLNTVKLSDEQLLKVTGILMSFEFLINLVWAVYDPLQPVFVKIQPVVFSPKCTAPTAWSFATAALVYKGLIGVYCLVCALQIRAYNEGKSIIAAVGIMLLLAAVVFPYSQSLEDLVISHVVIAIGIIAGMLAVINISFGNLVATYLFEPHVLDVIPNEEVALSAASS
jgi:hypothetical protein